MKYNTFNIIIGMILGGIVSTVAFSLALCNNKPIEQTQCEPCECYPLEEILLDVAKTERFIDLLQKAPKGKRNQLIDSINFYRAKHKSKGNLIEY